MTDFLTRVAERALGTAPRITPQVMSIYAPARLPLPTPAAFEFDSAPASASPEVNFEPRAKVLSRPAQRVTEIAAKDEESARYDENLTAAKPEPTHVTALRDKQPQPLSLTVFEQESDPALNNPTVAEFRPQPTKDLPPPSKNLGSLSKQDNREISSSEPAEIFTFHQRQAVQTVESNPAFAESARSANDPKNGKAPSPVSSGDRNDRESPGDLAKQPGRPSARAIQSPPTPRIESPEENNPHNERTRSVEPDSASPSFAVPAEVRPEINTRNSFPESSVQGPDPRISHLNNERVENDSPVIRVTIGRVEVHAVTPPLPPAESVAPPMPKLSLDEYLRAHNGRRG